MRGGLGCLGAIVVFFVLAVPAMVLMEMSGSRAGAPNPFLLVAGLVAFGVFKMIKDSKPKENNK